MHTHTHAAPKEHTGIAVCLSGLGWPFGSILASGSAWPLIRARSDRWRRLYYAMAAAHLAALLVLVRWLPESPDFSSSRATRWAEAAVRKEEEKATAAAEAQLRGQECSERGECKWHVPLPGNRSAVLVPPPAPPTSPPFLTGSGTFWGMRAATVALLGVVWFSVSAAGNSFAVYLPTLLDDRFHHNNSPGGGGRGSSQTTSDLLVWR